MRKRRNGFKSHGSDNELTITVSSFTVMKVDGFLIIVVFRHFLCVWLNFLLRNRLIWYTERPLAVVTRLRWRILTATQINATIFIIFTVCCYVVRPSELNFINVLPCTSICSSDLAFVFDFFCWF